jgi:hypothetical protein
VTAIEIELTNASRSEKCRRGLTAGVLKQAARDLRRFNGSTTKAGQELYFDAYRWLTANDFSWPFSFLNVCRSLSLVPETVREELVGDLSVDKLTCWKRRGGRAVRRFRHSLTQLFAPRPDLEGQTSASSQQPQPL